MSGNNGGNNTWEDQANDLDRQTQQMNLGGNGSSNGRNFQPGAQSFRPGQSGFAPAFNPYAAQQQQQQYPQQYQQQAQAGYGGYGYDQQQQYGGGYQQQGYGGTYQQGAYGQQYNGNYQNYNQQSQPQQQQQYGGYQTGYAEQETRTYDPSARKKPSVGLPAAKGPAKVLSLGSATGPAKSISIGGSAPAKTVSIGGGSGAAKTISIGGSGSAAKTVSLGDAPVKTVSIGGSSSQASAAKPATPAAVDSPKPAASPAPVAAPAVADTPSAAPSAAQSSADAIAADPAPPAAATGSGTSSSKAEKAAEKRQEAAVKAQIAEAQAQAEQLDSDLLADVYGKEHVSIVFIGHVDAGKSTLGGQLLILTGMVDQRTVDKFRREAAEMGRESWVYSWALDSTKQERSKGITVEVGRAHFETDKRAYSILDAPGHKSFVPNMIGGASQADVGVLVISARSGEYEAGFEKGGQTREHAILAKTQGVNKLIVVINKMDDPTVNWSKERYDECTSKLAQFLRREAGYNPKTDVHFMPVSAFTGAGLKDRIPKDLCPWYDGPALIEYLDGMQSFERKINAPLMMPVSTKWKDLGTIIEGKLESGHVKKGHKALLMPGSTQVEITTIYNETEEEVEGALCGEQVRMKIKGVEEEDILNGFVLCSAVRPIHTVTAFEAQIAIIELPSLLTAGFSCVMHVHTAIEEITFAALLHKLDKTNRKSKAAPAFAKQGMKIVARLETQQPVCLEKFADYAQLGRFTLRDSGVTIAIGKVTKLLS
ncbi:translation termination factor GTPase eRF3 [Savitreella phatthalungensis]